MSWLYIVTTVILYLANLTTGEEPKIIIVGAGPSGVAAASKLYENGFQDVTILEAENRIGGRVYTTWFDESWIDLGAQWVHGETDNIVYELAQPHGVLEVPNEEGDDFTVFNSDGNLIPTSINNDLMGIFSNVTERSSDDFIGNNGSVGDYYTRMITIDAAKIPTVHETTVKQYLKLFEGLLGLLDASESWFNTSARGYEEYEECAGRSGINWKDRGYGTIFDILMKKYPNPENELPVQNNTKLNTEVVKIDYNSTEGKVLMESSNGEKYTADHVIFTPSLGVLKEQYETLFTPELPEYKIKTVKGLAIGTIAKIYLSYDTPWWPLDDYTRFGLVWNETDKQEYENDPDKKWLLDIVAFYAVPHRPKLLCGWVYGPAAHYMESLPEQQVLNESMSIINKFFGKTYNITKPTAILRSTWYSNKHFRGSYSFRSMESDRTDVWASGLAAPLMVNDKPIVLFAGEATSTHHYGTVHGAIETGFREADRLINLYNKTTTIVI